MKKHEKRWFLLQYFIGLKHLLFQRQRHFFHIVSPSPWPIYTAFSVLSTAICFVGYMHSFVDMGFFFVLSLILVLLPLSIWFADIIAESRSQHTLLVQKSLLRGFVLFIISEVMFFASFFWAFFHSSLAPTIWISCAWPPIGLEIIPAFELPLLNTCILLSSGITVTWAHKALISGHKDDLIEGLLLTYFLAWLFLMIQFVEYRFAAFSIYDGIYGSCFFMLTGFHGFHVFLGAVMLHICLLRSDLNHFSKGNHIGFISAAWYWHFVDVVWLLLFVFVYWWGNTSICLHFMNSALLLLDSLLLDKTLADGLLYDVVFDAFGI